MKYSAKFMGRKVGAIGITYPIDIVVEGDDMASARLSLNDKYEHIFKLTLELINE